MSKSVKNTSQLRANPKNPRRITDKRLEMLRQSIAEFGDLSGVVFNRKTGQLIGGHQRVKIFEKVKSGSAIEVSKAYPKPTPQGTVLEGFIKFDGERYFYREVVWTPAKEKAAMIAANKHSGEWDEKELKGLLLELEEEFSGDILGFQDKELERILKEDLTLDIASEADAAGNGSDLTAENQPLPSHVRMLQLFLNAETHPVFIERVTALGKTFKTKNVTDTVFKAVEFAHAKNKTKK